MSVPLPSLPPPAAEPACSVWLCLQLTSIESQALPATLDTVRLWGPPLISPCSDAEGPSRQAGGLTDTAALSARLQHKGQICYA